MYSNIGKNIKLFAKVVFVLEAFVAVVVGIVLLGIKNLEIPGVLILILGPFSAWVSTWLLYGYGELIDKVCIIAKNTRHNETKSETQNLIDDERIEKLEKLRAQGLISEEEYQRTIGKSMR
mgnify:CR=1 FL=1